MVRKSVYHNNFGSARSVHFRDTIYDVNHANHVYGTTIGTSTKNKIRISKNHHNSHSEHTDLNNTEITVTRYKTTGTTNKINYSWLTDYSSQISNHYGNVVFVRTPDANRPHTLLHT